MMTSSIGIFKIIDTLTVKYSLILSVICVASINFYYEGGNLTEEYCLPFLIWSLYFVLKYLENSEESEHKPLYTFFYGITFMVGVLTRITNALPVCCGIFIIFIRLIVNKKRKNILHNILMFILGNIVFVLPFIIYFIHKNALYDMIYGMVIYNFKYATAGGMIFQIVLAYTTDVGMVAGHTLIWCLIAVGMYAVGYFVGNVFLTDTMSGARVSIMTVLMIISSVVVLICNHQFDGQIIYDRIVVFYEMAVLDLWICMVIYKLGEHLKSGWILRIINHLDSISYEFYIVHGLIIAAVTYNVLFKFGTIPYVLSTLVLSWMAAVVLHKVCELIQNITQDIT